MKHYIAKQIVRIYIGSAIVLLGSCSQPKDKPTKDVCYCDSVYYNENSSEYKEVLCYKGEDVYKLKLRNNEEVLSRHSLNNPKFLYENLTSVNSIIIKDKSRFLSVNSSKGKFTINLIGKDVDSMEVYVNLNDKKELAGHGQGNAISIDEKVLNGTSNSISVVSYETNITEIPNLNKKDKVVTSHEFFYPNYTKLLYGPLDSVLARFKKCINR